MISDSEIKALLDAIELSPDNTQLRWFLVQKIKDKVEYQDELEKQLKAIIQNRPLDTPAKELLARLYYDKGKYSAAVIICEELLSSDKITLRGRTILAKSYLKDGSPEQARAIYEDIVNKDPFLRDEVLDREFRMGIKEAYEILDDEEESRFLEKPDISFEDVGGMDAVKKEINLKIIKPLEHKELFATYGKKVGGGILLFGPPGCGKTFIAKATAGQINANFINVSLNDILDMWIGNSEKNLHDFFDLARQNTPCVLFFDEIDALGAKRSDMRMSAGKNVINQFLAELDGIENNNEGILIIGATNTPWHLDSAFRRPGRFDRIIFVPPPDEASKAEILKLKLQKKPITDIDYKAIAKKTDKYSGADINAIIDIAIEEKLVKAMETGIPENLTTRDLVDATKKHNPSTVDWFTTAKNYAMFANQSGIYDDILKYLK